MSNLTPQQTLQTWLQQEEEIRARLQAGPGPGLARPDQAATLDGLSFMQAMLRGELPYPHICDTLSFGLIEVAHGRAVFQGEPKLAHYNPLGGVHGGWYATLLDSALGCAVHTAMPQGRGYTTLELKTNMIRSITTKVSRVRAIGEVVHVGAQTATAQARLVGPDGKLYGHASTTCLVFELPPARA